MLKDRSGNASFTYYLQSKCNSETEPVGVKCSKCNVIVQVNDYTNHFESRSARFVQLSMLHS